MTHIACVAGVITGRGAFSSAQLIERRREANLDLALLLANEEGGLVKGGRAVLNGPVGDTEPGTMPGTDDDIAPELALVERAARVGARRGDDVEAISETDQEDRHIAGLGSNHLPLTVVRNRADIGPIGHSRDEGVAIDPSSHSKTKVAAEEGAEEDHQVSQARDQDAGKDETARRLVAEEQRRDHHQQDDRHDQAMDGRVATRPARGAGVVGVARGGRCDHPQDADDECERPDQRGKGAEEYCQPVGQEHHREPTQGDCGQSGMERMAKRFGAVKKTFESLPGTAESLVELQDRWLHDVRGAVQPGRAVYPPVEGGAVTFDFLAGLDHNRLVFVGHSESLSREPPQRPRPTMVTYPDGGETARKRSADGARLPAVRPSRSCLQHSFHLLDDAEWNGDPELLSEAVSERSLPTWLEVVALVQEEDSNGSSMEWPGGGGDIPGVGIATGQGGIGTGAPLALCGGDGLDADRGDLRGPAALRFPVAAIGADQLGDLPASLADVGRIPELSPASRWQPLQPGPAVDVLRRDLHPGPDSDRDWAGDVACVQRTLSLVLKVPWRQAGRPQRSLHRLVPILRLPGWAHGHGDHQWRAEGICQDLPRFRSRQFLVGNLGRSRRNRGHSLDQRGRNLRHASQPTSRTARPGSACRSDAARALATALAPALRGRRHHSNERTLGQWLPPGECRIQ